MDLKHAVKIEEVLKPAWQYRREIYKKVRVEEEVKPPQNKIKFPLKQINMSPEWNYTWSNYLKWVNKYSHTVLTDVETEQRLLVIGDAAVNDRFLAGINDDKGQVNDWIFWWCSVCLLLCLTVTLHEVLKRNLLNTHEKVKYISLKNKINYLNKCNQIQ